MFFELVLFIQGSMSRDPANIMQTIATPAFVLIPKYTINPWFKIKLL